MACMRLGSKADVFHLQGQSWLCTAGLPSDVCIIVEDISFHLHKFPLSSRSQLLDKLIQDNSTSQTSGDDKECILSLPNLPGGAKSFLLIAKFCYNVKIEVTAGDIVSLRCASEYLKMTEEYGEANLITQTVNFLDKVLESWIDTIKVLETCEAVLPFSEQLHIISACIDSLAAKACSEASNPGPTMEDWWYHDVAILKLPLFKRLMLAIGSKGILTPERISGAVMYYAKRYLPLNGRQSSCDQRNPKSTFHVLSDAEQRTLIEEIIELLPNQKDATPTDFLLRLLKMSMILHVSSSCREILEIRIGAQLDRAVLQDLLIPNIGYSVETLYDVDCMQRIVNHFVDQEDGDPYFEEEDQLVEEGSRSPAPMTVVANLLDNYLAEVAPDVNLKLEKFVSLGASIPDYSRPLDDGIYRAIDIYLKAHPWLTNSEKELLCRLMNCQKLSLEASTHAAQNERLPLRVIVQVLFFEQIRIRTSVAGWFFISDNSQNISGQIPQRNDRTIPLCSEVGQVTTTFNDMREKLSELEKECKDMKRDIEKLVKTKGSRNNFVKRFCLKSFDLKSVLLACNGDALRPSRKAVLNRKVDNKLAG